MGIYFLETKGQTITEWAMLFVVVALVMVFAINGPVKDSMNIVFNNLIDEVANSLDIFSAS